MPASLMDKDRDSIGYRGAGGRFSTRHGVLCVCVCGNVTGKAVDVTGRDLEHKTTSV